MLKKIYKELVAIKEELQAVNRNLNPSAYSAITSILEEEGLVNCTHCRRLINKEDKYCIYCGTLNKKKD